MWLEGEHSSPRSRAESHESRHIADVCTCIDCGISRSERPPYRFAHREVMHSGRPDAAADELILADTNRDSPREYDSLRAGTSRPQRSAKSHEDLPGIVPIMRRDQQPLQ